MYLILQITKATSYNSHKRKAPVGHLKEMYLCKKVVRLLQSVDFYR